jgi:hypothetical protein
MSCGMGCLLMMLSYISIFLIIPLGGILVIPYIIFLPFAWVSLAILSRLLTPWRCQRCGGTGNPAHEPLPRKPLSFPKIPFPSVNWAMIFSGIRRSPLAIDQNLRIAWSMVEAGYSELPDWAQPIIWGLGLSAPVAIVAIGIWTVSQY